MRRATGSGSQDLALTQKEIIMPTMINFRHRRSNYFHSHPLHGSFALIASMALAALIVVAILLGMSEVAH